MKPKTRLHRTELSLPAGVFFAILLFASIITPARADLEVATLHPMVTDLATKVGGSHVRVIPLMSAGEDIHNFTPSSSEMAKARSVNAIIASGKGLELYLPRLKDTVGDSVKVVEVGNAVRSVRLSGKDAIFACCPAHAKGSIDPHWWHSISGMQQAAGYLAKELGKLDPPNASAYKANARAWSAQLDQLENWAKREISRVPRSKRYLATAHAAFGYFCRDFGFKSIPLSGLSEESTSSAYLAEAIGELRKNGVRTVFPERNANPRAVDSVAKTAGLRKGTALIADGSASGVTTYEAFVRHNIQAIVSGLAE